MWSRYDGHFEFSTLRMVIIRLDTVIQVQNIQFESIVFFLYDSWTMFCPHAIKWPFAYGIIGLQQGYGVHFNICDTLPPKLGSNIPSLHDPSSIPIVSQRPSIMVMWSPKWPMGWRQQIHKVSHVKRTKYWKYLD